MNFFSEITPTKNNMVKEGFTVEKQYELSLEIKAETKKNGWTNIVRVTDGKRNCCNRGSLLPGLYQ